MNSQTILETERLSLHKFTTQDSEFLIRLLNTNSWLKYIGDKNVKSPSQAESYINTLISDYGKNGFGLWLIKTKQHKEAIGMCGLVKRDYLESPDIGFALLPEYEGHGFAFEAAAATISHLRNQLGIKRVLGITQSNNTSSINLLMKLGLKFDRIIDSSGSERLLLYSSLG